MGYETYVICGLIASPGDTQSARDLMPKVFRAWNNAHAESRGLTLRSLLWELDSVPSLDGPPQKVINRDLVCKADFLIAFFNNRVGSATETEISGTVEEIKEFEAANKPVLLYFCGATVDRETATSEQFKQLADLKQVYSAKGLVGTYSEIRDLEAKIRDHLPIIVQKIQVTLDEKRQAKRAEAEAIQVAVERNRFLKAIVKRLNNFEKLTDRCANREPDLKGRIARFFWSHMHGEVVTKDVRNLFFESGSTLVYLAEEFVARCKADHGALDRWMIKTNNIITYLNFVLFEHVDIVLSPYGPPDNEYGATFGALQLPDVDPPTEAEGEWELDPKVRSLIERQASELLSLTAPSLILATASGLELDEKHRYPGLHVGSYQNMLFKRAIFKSLHPTVIFLHEDKISTISKSGKFVFGKCYPVFDHRKVWESILSSAPLSFCIGFTTIENAELIKKHFERFGFRTKANKDGMLLIRNAAWDAMFGKRVDVRI